MKTYTIGRDLGCDIVINDALEGGMAKEKTASETCRNTIEPDFASDICKKTIQCNSASGTCQNLEI